MHQIIFVGNKTFNVRKSDLNKITENSQFWDIIHIIRGEGVIIDKTNFNKIIFKSRDTICVPHDIEVEFKYKDKISNIFVRFDSLFLPCKSIINLENSHKDLLKDIFIHCKNLYDSNLYKSNKECDLQKKIFDCLTELIVTTINYSYKNMSKYSPIVEKIYNAIVIHYSDPDF
ncbi:MAG: hypothetical protein LBU60_03705, partial [Clostridiales bacterium]|nr:hypothetical protein [Clostridiales bacterium]